MNQIYRTEYPDYKITLIRDLTNARAIHQLLQQQQLIKASP